MQKYGQEGFFFSSLSWNWNIEVMNISTLVQMIFDTWFGWVCWLFSVNVLIWLLSTSTSLPDHGVSPSEITPARNVASCFWHVQSVPAPSLYTAQLFFWVSVAFLPFLKWQNIECQKILLFPSIFNIKIATQKFTGFDNFFKTSHWFDWYDGCHNTT